MAVPIPANCGVGNQQPPPCKQSAAEDSTAEGQVLVVVDDNGSGGGDGLYNNKIYGPNQYAERDVVIAAQSRPPTASSESRRLTPAE